MFGNHLSSSKDNLGDICKEYSTEWWSSQELLIFYFILSYNYQFVSIFVDPKTHQESGAKLIKVSFLCFF